MFWRDFLKSCISDCHDRGLRKNLPPSIAIQHTHIDPQYSSALDLVVNRRVISRASLPLSSWTRPYNTRQYPTISYNTPQYPAKPCNTTPHLASPRLLLDNRSVNIGDTRDSWGDAPLQCTAPANMGPLSYYTHNYVGDGLKSLGRHKNVAFKILVFRLC